MFHNTADREILIRVERAAPRHDALTAARAASIALVPRALSRRGPGSGPACDRLDRDALIHLDRSRACRCSLPRAGRRACLRSDPRAPQGAGERHSPGRRSRHQDDGRRRAGVFFAGHGRRRHGACHFRGGSIATSRRLLAGLRVGIHKGPALAATLDDQLDYFGTTVRDVVGILSQARDGELVLTQVVAADLEVAALLHEHGIETEIVPTTVAGHRHLIRVRLNVQPRVGE